MAKHTKSTKKAAKKNPSLKVNTSFENLLKLVVDTPKKKKK